MNPYRRNILPLISDLLGASPPISTGLDFGAGDGWFATQLQASRLVSNITAIDVKARPNSLGRVQLYDGGRLPFQDRSFELTYSIDVLHHCPDPVSSLQDLARCSSRLLLLKDHTWSTAVGRAALAVMDELGNRRFGIPSLYLYQKNFAWFPVIEAAGFRLVRAIHPAPCHSGLLGRCTNSLQFLALWERIDAS